MTPNVTTLHVTTLRVVANSLIAKKYDVNIFQKFQDKT
jgi:hypothetical protein